MNREETGQFPFCVSYDGPLFLGSTTIYLSVYSPSSGLLLDEAGFWQQSPGSCLMRPVLESTNFGVLRPASTTKQGVSSELGTRHET